MTLEGLPYIIAALLAISSPAILFGIIGILVKKQNPKAAKVFFNLIWVYFILFFILLIIGIGICGGFK
ncbi:hypothetical protein PG637_05010 [Riemerella anatipestifer]|uniref:hypothetical protein n=1 Tax=Riemerella anatipestifer TaxID=34085 RepID=UPI00129D90D6|nr:hypothetical protein [Riemerella anatipestifer]MDY3318764.1 hypothetical protein [Riemerella anatipestifer]MDY3325035.1 hypothetical protein [Riemerella anatipestifer]MDY3353844.1 hypothetical protein [Riemerella anatipestifer]MRM83599.1 hypothetical protein [Riemerella anatipestifer]